MKWRKSCKIATIPCLRYFIGDVRDAPRLEMALSGVEFVVHAAALKQVPTAEYNPFECIHTNVVGAENVVRACIRAGVKHVIALSTDKAANPINLYGASKLASDKILIAANHLSGAHGPRFAVVRYGNVVGSRGSVVPFFQQRLRENAEYLPITHMEMTRFWITLEQGIDFVIIGLRHDAGGRDLRPQNTVHAHCRSGASTYLRIHRSNASVLGQARKLHELMITEDDACNTIELEDRYVIKPAFAAWDSGRMLEIEGQPVTGEVLLCQ